MQRRAIIDRSRKLLLWLSLCLCLALPCLAHAQGTPTFPATSTVLQTANLRASPSTTGDRIGSAPAGSTLTLSGCNAACDWYQTAEGAWSAAFLVEVEAGRAALLPTSTPTVQGTPATVTKIVDGDTIDVSIAGATQRACRLTMRIPGIVLYRNCLLQLQQRLKGGKTRCRPNPILVLIANQRH